MKPKNSMNRDTNANRNISCLITDNRAMAQMSLIDSKSLIAFLDLAFIYFCHL